MRFLNKKLESKKDKKSLKLQTSLDSFTNKNLLYNSEIYHLKAIEIACRYIPGVCPYVNHLLTSF